MNRLFLADEVEGRLLVPLEVEGEANPLRCFVRVYYVWAASESEASSFISLDMSRDAEVVAVGPVGPIRLEDVEEDIRASIQEEPGRGVCWRSGRIFFPCESE